MDHREINRLSLRQMTGRQLSQAAFEQASLNQLQTNSFAFWEKNTPEKSFKHSKSPADLSKSIHSTVKKVTNKTDDAWLNTAYPEYVNHIINHVHERMKPQPFDVEAKIASIPTVLSPPPNPSKPKKRGKRCKKNQMDHSKSVMQGNYMSIPKIKADAQTKALQNQRRQSIVLAQERARAIVNQKQMLHEMLMEHQKLQRDRANIASEIQTMKSYLGDIKKRLDTSLRTLNINAKVARR